ncbi:MULTISPECIES: hypothetical protein [Pseudoalteromonas]|uniref:hypothetical protein n=1 Tax=Pseudoalteromonas TaxID=53246 RepID=UPI000C7B2326|nr:MULTISPECIES: hypothetical protein [unclassified Pseudoalteromonas]AUJ72390.1 hypothetical protein PNC201_20870 [Pseudoalteromonas sp. NC201]MCF7516467.1 hypothetical protein [Pseudoalteromonas sp. L7]MCF7528515.1 hypothetical protein [Pseudoalteromonas sp. L23]MCG7554497.1 hypothetical protein [Pseudoalteromonas sp. Of11M-6]
MKVICSLFSAVLFAITTSALSYEIGKKAVKNESAPTFDTDKLGIVGIEWERNHEKMTVLALQCLAEANINETEITNMPNECNSQISENNNIDIYSSPNKYPEAIRDYYQLVKSIRWSDDPTRQVQNKDRTAAKFAATIKRVCNRRLDDDPDNKIDITDDGLLCASHLGELQFLHSMASANGIPSEKTLNKVIEWSNFAFNLSLGSSDLSQPYCDHWSSGEYPNIEPALGVDNVRAKGWCEERPISFWSRLFNTELWNGKQKTFKGFSVATTFNLACDGMFISASCTVIENEDEVRMAALGSVLHLIQDSYSKSHTDRGAPGVSPSVKCDPVKAFRSYKDQNTQIHTKSDKWPSFDSNCRNREEGNTVDPITASAQIIWLHANPKTTNTTVTTLINSVYGEVPKGVLSTAGEGYSAE